VIVLGSGFAPGHVMLRAYQLFGFSGKTRIPVTPDVVTANAYGNFFTSVTICGYFGFGSPSRHGILFGIGSNWVQSNLAFF